MRCEKWDRLKSFDDVLRNLSNRQVIAVSKEGGDITEFYRQNSGCLECSSDEGEKWKRSIALPLDPNYSYWNTRTYPDRWERFKDSTKALISLYPEMKNLDNMSPKDFCAEITKAVFKEIGVDNIEMDAEFSDIPKELDNKTIEIEFTKKVMKSRHDVDKNS